MVFLKGHKVNIGKKHPQTDETRKKISKTLKGNIPWNKNKRGYTTKKKGYIMSEETKEKLRQANVGKKLSKEIRKKISLALKGKKQSTKERKMRSEIAKKGDQSIFWKGNKVSYGGLHYWIRKNLGKAKKCKNREKQIFDFKCNKKSKRFHWANADHKYNKNLIDWMSLCNSCHKLYDYKKHLSNIGSRYGSIKNKI